MKSVFFFQERPGKDCKPFRLIKFKTMNSARGPDGLLLPNMQRITRLGSFLRQTSLDELPQLINVVEGDLSLVGPRPLEMRYLPHYSKEQMRRHTVRPGITGWAQVNGRNAISWEEKYRYDVWYVDNVSFFIDLQILLMTVAKVIRRTGINANDQTTVVPFDEYMRAKKKWNSEAK